MRGGARKNAGRKRELTELEQINIGAWCDALQLTASEQKTLKLHKEKTPQQLKDARASLTAERESKPVFADKERDRKRLSERASKISAKHIEPLFKRKKRYKVLRAKRALTRDEIMSKAALEFGISYRRVQDSWKFYRRVRDQL